MALPRPSEQALLSSTHLAYGLQALPVILALISRQHVARSFVFTLPAILAVIISYWREPLARGTYLESHHRWLIHTFWIALATYAVLWIVTLPLKLVLIGFPLFYLGLTFLGAWIIYRLARGWLALRDHRPL